MWTVAAIGGEIAKILELRMLGRVNNNHGV
jgi:hypothetical protein